jgi:hypothetical protein
MPEAPTSQQLHASNISTNIGEALEGRGSGRPASSKPKTAAGQCRWRSPPVITGSSR